MLSTIICAVLLPIAVHADVQSQLRGAEQNTEVRSHKTPFSSKLAFKNFDLKLLEVDANTISPISEAIVVEERPSSEAFGVEEDTTTRTLDATTASTLPTWALYSSTYGPGYFLERTRRNTDCTGLVMAIAGSITNVAHVTQQDPTTVGSQVSQVSLNDAYTFTTVTYSDKDGTVVGGSPAKSTGNRCDKKQSTALPSYGITNQIKGYFYGHTVYTGSFPGFASKNSGIYELQFDTLQSCLNGVQPISFLAHGLTNQCLFDSEIKEGEQHFYVQPVSYDVVSQTLSYNVYNNDDCLATPGKKTVTKSVSVETVMEKKVNTCVASPDGTWMKVRAY